MYNNDAIQTLVKYIEGLDGIGDKEELAQKVQQEFSLQDNGKEHGKILFCDSFALRFSSTKGNCFSNTVLSLSNLQKYDNIPFIVCAVSPEINTLLLANTTFLKKISHSSQELDCQHIVGSFNGSDIMGRYKTCDASMDILNIPEHFCDLFSIHERTDVEKNLARLVENTKHTRPRKEKYMPTSSDEKIIYQSIERTVNFLSSSEYNQLAQGLSDRIEAVKTDIIAASHIKNGKPRGQFIEALITGENPSQRELLRKHLHEKKYRLPIQLANDLGDYERRFSNYHVKVDIKSKLLYRSGNPKVFNIDKVLSFLAQPNSIYLLYIVAVDETDNIHPRLCSIYEERLLNNMTNQSKWAGKNGRGTTQCKNKALKEIVVSHDQNIDFVAAQEFLMQCLNL